MWNVYYGGEIKYVQGMWESTNGSEMPACRNKDETHVQQISSKE